MQDLNDLSLFAQVVEYGGFAAASRATGIAKSKLSRRVSELERRLGVRLIQRSSRKFAVTDLGRDYFQHILAMLEEAAAAQDVIERSRAEPRGVVRVSCPPGLVCFEIGDILARFMAQHPRVEVHLDSTSRRVDPIGEAIDVAIRVRFPPLDESDLVMRVLGDSAQRLVGSSGLLARCPAPPSVPADLSSLPSLDFCPPHRDHVWRLEGPDGATAQVVHRPRLVTDDISQLRAAALQGVGLAQIPAMAVDDDIAQGTLVDVLPAWRPRSGIVHAVFPSRRGLLPAVRSLIDFLAAAYAARAGGRVPQ